LLNARELIFSSPVGKTDSGLPEKTSTTLIKPSSAAKAKQSTGESASDQARAVIAGRLAPSSSNIR